MKKFLFLIVLLALCLTLPISADLDLSLFENDPIYRYEVDDMTDNVEITIPRSEETDITSWFQDYSIRNDDSVLFGEVVIRHTVSSSGYPMDILAMALLPRVKNEINPNQLIIKTKYNRYTFDGEFGFGVNRQPIYFDDGFLFYNFVFGLTQDSAQFIKDIYEEYKENGEENAEIKVKARLSGINDVDFELTFNALGVKKILDDFTTAGGFQSDYAVVVNEMYPCTIKPLTK